MIIQTNFHYQSWFYSGLKKFGIVNRLNETNARKKAKEFPTCNSVHCIRLFIKARSGIIKLALKPKKISIGIEFFTIDILEI